jgi:hypothetical protein
MNDKLIESFWATGGFMLALIVIGSVIYLVTEYRDRKERERINNLPVVIPTFDDKVIVKSQKQHDDTFRYHIYINGKDVKDIYSKTMSVYVPDSGFRYKEEAIESAKLIFERLGKDFGGEYDFKEVYAILPVNSTL